MEGVCARTSRGLVGTCGCAQGPRTGSDLGSRVAGHQAHSRTELSRRCRRQRRERHCERCDNSFKRTHTRRAAASTRRADRRRSREEGTNRRREESRREAQAAPPSCIHHPGRLPIRNPLRSHTRNDRPFDRRQLPSPARLPQHADPHLPLPEPPRARRRRRSPSRIRHPRLQQTIQHRIRDRRRQRFDREHERACL